MPVFGSPPMQGGSGTETSVFYRASASIWTSSNPILGLNEIGQETDTLKIKCGDGTSTWNELDYQGLEGPDGPQGEQGIQGEPGQDSTVPGPQGIQGEPGQDSTVPGPQGIQGIQGDAGSQGTQGIQGVPGQDSTVPGPKGDTGSQGIQGIKGDTGNTGNQGVQGVPGQDSTVPGPKGDTGNQGIQGVKGDTGDTGSQGIQGVKGDTGDQGIQGIQGIQGEQGIQGPAGAAGYAISVQALTSSPTDSQTVYFGMLPKAPTTTANTSKIYIRAAGTIKRAEIYVYSGTAGTNESWSLYIRKNNTTDTLIATLAVSASERVFTNKTLSIAVADGDYIEIKGVQPLWATNPLTTIYGGYVYIE